MKYSKNNISTGSLLNNYFVKNRINKAELCRDLNRNGMAVTNFLKNNTIQTTALIDICYALKHNFFQDMANLLPKDFSVDKTLNASNENSINQILEENRVLKIQNEVLMRVRG